MRIIQGLNLLKNALRRKPPFGFIGLAKSAVDYYREPAAVSGSPLFLQIEPTILCNLECAYCINPTLSRDRTSLSFEKFKHILSEVPLINKISLVGIGESFMNKDLWKIIRYAKSSGLEIGTTTNATILNARLLDEIFSSGLDWLNFSIDGATKKTYEAMRPGANFEDVIANIHRIVSAAGKRAKPRLAVWFLSNSNNISELPDMVPLVKELGITELHTQGVHYWGHPDWYQGAQEANNIPSLRDHLKKTRDAADALDVSFQWVNFPDEKAPRSCKWPWKGAYITADGHVTPCCENGSDPKRITFGNIFDKSFSDIWNSHNYRTFRRELREKGTRPAICKDCPSYNKPITLEP